MCRGLGEALPGAAFDLEGHAAYILAQASVSVSGRAEGERL
jgi:hypothetical protein